MSRIFKQATCLLWVAAVGVFTVGCSSGTDGGLVEPAPTANASAQPTTGATAGATAQTTPIDSSQDPNPNDSNNGADLGSATPDGSNESGGLDGSGVQPARTIRIGIKLDQPGIGLLEADSDTPEGFDVDVAAYVAWKLGFSPYNIEWVEARSPFREILLDSGEVDMVVASYWWSQDRASVVDFAGPYLIVGQDLLVRTEDTDITGIADVAGKRLCGVSGSIPLIRARAMLGNSADYLEETQYSDCVQRLIDDQVDVVTTDNLILAGLAGHEDFYGQVRLVNAPFSQEQYVIGLPPGSTELCHEVTAALQEMISDGSWLRFITRHTDITDFIIDPELNPPQPNLPCG